MTEEEVLTGIREKHLSEVTSLELVWLYKQVDEKIKLKERFEVLSEHHNQALEDIQLYNLVLQFYADGRNYLEGFLQSSIKLDGGRKASKLLEAMK